MGAGGVCGSPITPLLLPIAPWGRRGWKSFHAVLRGTLLCFLKVGAAPTAEAEEMLGVHHGLAEQDSHYTKRPHVFRLHTADSRVLLLQAPSHADMLAWISRLNLAAALLSSPPFPAAVGSQRRLTRHILPAAPSHCPPEQQLRTHLQWLERAELELLELQRNPTEKRGRGRDMEEQHRDHLQHECRRYETYVRVLETWLSNERDLEGWDGGGVPAEPPPLTRAHSSPALGPDTTPPPGPPRVKRNISERRTVRKGVPKRNRNLL
ncbi:PH and SEC7 domain-containing protein 4-like [Coturnix japonica]|uniref:PH and SEC7 domain-containing protein 4-like n=1 Tax=Coturnix japonica TaxID=93934 RepID=UPI00077775BA|nr:PH and SEC7 domain-containing protein 4-like [Coturnix japonica]